MPSILTYDKYDKYDKQGMNDTKQGGFTLLELLVAMAIFALLAVTGWQVFDSLNRSKERGATQIQTLSQLQYAYQQIQRDMMQVVAYNLPPPASSNRNSTAQTPALPQNGLQLANNTLSFVRYADPDPRYQEVPTLERVEYQFIDGQLIRRRYAGLSSSTTSNDARIADQSQLLSDVDAGLLQVLLPEPSIIYPDERSLLYSLEQSQSRAMSNRSGENTDDNNNGSDSDSDNANGENGDAVDASIIPAPMLPKGVSMSFNIQIGAQPTPIEWRFALPNAAPVIPATDIATN